MEFVKKYKLDVLLIGSLFLTTPLFFYKLGQSSLVSWDEAWYGEIARNILNSGDFLRLTFNNSPYIDHPPVGFWLNALSFWLMGVSDFSARFFQALAGFLSILLIYFLGKELFNRYIGFLSAMALCSSSWFLYRARSGNLDATLTMLFILTFLLALNAAKSKIYLIPFTISLALLFLTKTLIPFTIIPALIVIFWKVKIYRLKDLILVGFVLMVPVVSWVVLQLKSRPDFFNHYLMIGYPGVEAKTSISDNFNLTKEYLHSGMGKWFWPGVGATLGGLFLRQKRFFAVFIFCATFLLPFLFSHKGHIWHLIPVYPFLILSFFGFSWVFLEKIVKQKILVILPIFIFAFYIFFIQTKQNWYQFIDIPRFISDEAILSTEAGKYQQLLLIDDDFVPAAVYYSGKNVSKIWQGGLKELFDGPNSFLLITHQWRLDGANIAKDKYQIVKSDRDKILILKR